MIQGAYTGRIQISAHVKQTSKDREDGVTDAETSGHLITSGNDSNAVKQTETKVVRNIARLIMNKEVVNESQVCERWVP
jgi:hypothetical protein